MTLAPPTPTSTTALLPLLSTSQLTPSSAPLMMQDPSALDPLMMQDPPTTSQSYASQSTQSVPDIDPSAWRPPLGDSRELLYLHVNQVATHITAIFQEQFNGPYHTWSKIPQLGGWGAGKHMGGSFSFTEMIMKWDLTQRFSKSKYLEELHKHQKGEKKGEDLNSLNILFCRRNFKRSEERPRRILRRQVLLCPMISSRWPL
ncbi:hypothetical protein M9H77_25511 [Catharanthus roseus]|uniref:Uncharacterized protein n=1 Tax=Catharanthus roseus TaxID=4058 RepID=A0ACC0A9P1_CATRO|nr:hypothetical protein M9H77_25511 [Catharanthus roseus]